MTEKTIKIVKCAGRYIFKWGGIVINWGINNQFIMVITVLIYDITAIVYI